MKNTSMASLPALFCSIFVLSAAINAPVIGASKEFKVGGVEGWRQPRVNDTALYNQWAARNRFRVGDSLRFQYKDDSVLVVDKWGYFHCNMSHPISSFNDGNTVVNLDKPGPIYFISGHPDHCKDGQQLVIEVMGQHSTSRSPPASIATPPQSYFAVSPSPMSSSGVSANVGLISVTTAIISAFVAGFT